MTVLDDVLRKDRLYPHPERLVPFLGNHDTGRFMSEPGATAAELKMGFALVTTMRGMPQIFRTRGTRLTTQEWQATSL